MGGHAPQVERADVVRRRSGDEILRHCVHELFVVQRRHVAVELVGDVVELVLEG